MVTVAALTAVLIFAHGDVQEALLAGLGALGAVLLAALPKMLETKEEGK
jgi:hypothetical protein